MTAFGWFQVHYIIVTLIFFSPAAILLFCSSKKKFETDAKAELVPRNATPTNTPTKSHSMIKPTAQTPPVTTPVEKSAAVEEDTLANVQSLQPEISDTGADDKKKKGQAKIPEKNNYQTADYLSQSL